MQRREDPNIIYLKYVIKNFNNFLTDIEYVYKKNYRFGDYEYILHKLNEKMIFVYVLHNKIEIIKKNENKFEVTINLNDYLTIATMRRITRFMNTENKHYYNYLIWYHRGTWHFVLGNLIIPIRHDSRTIKLTIIKKPEQYYLSLPELEKRQIPDKKYGFPIIRNELYLYEINNKKVEKIIEYYKKKYRDMPYIIRIKLQNRKIEYAIYKFLIKKEIFKIYEKKEIPLMFRIDNYEIPQHAWYFTNIFTVDVKKVRGGAFPNFFDTTIQDYNYDSVNQILLKFVDPFNRTFLCGVDYSNSMWCMRLQGFMFKYSIKNVYKVMYDLDEQTKVFEF
jgi:hypothetical protein